MLHKAIPFDEWELNYYELAIKASGAVQAARWTSLPDGLGFIHSFNGRHSLFIDTIRTLRICALSHLLGHELLGEQDCKISLLDRLLIHARTSAMFNIYYGTGRDSYDIPELTGRTAHEAICLTARTLRHRPGWLLGRWRGTRDGNLPGALAGSFLRHLTGRLFRRIFAGRAGSIHYGAETRLALDVPCNSHRGGRHHAASSARR